MKLFMISDNLDALTGMRLAGIKGEVVSELQPFEQLFNNVLNNKEIGVVMISPNLIAAHQELVDDVRFNRSTPLIVELQGQNEYQHPSHSITDTIRRAIGMQL